MSSTHAPARARAPDPDLFEPEPPRKLLSIDWSKVKLASDADALALWAQIAPTGDDWQLKLDEIPHDVGRPLAIALLHGGNLRCVPPAPANVDCPVRLFDVPDPAPTAGFADPCLRRKLALWAIDELEVTDVGAAMDALRTIVAIPPPESQLVTAAIGAISESDNKTRLELAAIAYRADQIDIANHVAGGLDESYLIEAVGKHHIEGALEVLSAQGHRSIYLAAVTDEALSTKARTSAITDLTAADDKLAPDLKTTLVKAAGSRDCGVAASAARTLEARGDKRFVPRIPGARSTDKLMRALCVLASYEQLQRADEPSLLRTYVPAKGLERVSVSYDALSDEDPDGDGDPHTQRTVELVPRDQLVLPEVEDLARAMRHCKGTTCRSDDREFRFTFGGGFLTRLEMNERAPCPRQ